MLVTGVDENGLGPRLGPLVATAVTLDVRRYDRARLLRAGNAHGIGDSKQNSAFGKMAHAEGIALALLEALEGRAPRHADELLALLSLEGPLALRAPCPPGEAPRACFGEDLPLPAFGGDVEDGRARLAALFGGRRARVVRVRSAVVCPGVLNAELEAGRSKLAVDLHRFERLLLDARASLGGELHALCGMVGGIRDYSAYWGSFDPEQVAPVESPDGCCAYDVPRLGHVRFEVDADARHMPVGLASMVGKYLREVLLERMLRYYQGREPGLPRASGYHDKVTTRFVDGTAPLRRRLAIADDCFLRRR